MKRFLRIDLIILLAALLLAAGAAVEPGQAQTQTPTSGEGSLQRTVSVTGNGQASLRPDIATVRIGVSTDANTARDALNQNNQQMQALLSALADAGVSQENIQTQSIQLQPRYNQPTGQGSNLPELAGFTAVNIVQVRLEDTDSLGQILDAAVGAGGNTIEGINFEISDPSALYAQALEDAMTDARRKAEQLASLAGSQLGEILSISEGGSSPIPFGMGGVARGALDLAVPVEPGMQNITVQLQVTWQLGPSTSSLLPGTSATQTATRVPPTSTPAPTRVPPTSTPAQTQAPSPTATTQAPMSYTSLLSALDAQSIDVKEGGEIRQPFFPVTGKQIRFGGWDVQVFEFEDVAAREAVSDTITGTGGILEAIKATGAGQPHLWARGRIIVLYVGQDQDVINPLSKILGAPIAEA